MTKPYYDQSLALLTDLGSAVARLKEVIPLSPTRLHKDATIKRFEFTFELCWKLMQATVRYLGTDVFGPRESIRMAVRYDLITEPEQWMNLLNARNVAMHVYEETKADEVYEQARFLPPLVDALVSRAGKKLAEETTTGGAVGETDHETRSE